MLLFGVVVCWEGPLVEERVFSWPELPTGGRFGFGPMASSSQAQQEPAGEHAEESGEGRRGGCEDA